MKYDLIIYHIVDADTGEILAECVDEFTAYDIALRLKEAQPERVICVF